MALDIREGDILVVGGVEYPIRSCADWKWQHAAGYMARLATETASTKRQPDMSGGKRGAPVTKLTNIKCTPLDPVDPDVMQRLALNTPHELLQTSVNGADHFYLLIVEDLKR